MLYHNEKIFSEINFLFYFIKYNKALSFMNDLRIKIILVENEFYYA
jgi:hypothetical protein